MAAVASTHKVFTDNIPQIAKGKSDYALYHAKVNMRLGEIASTQDHIMLEASVLRKHTGRGHHIIYMTPRNNRKLSSAIKASKHTEKHLKSLDSYLGKLHNDSKEPTLSQRTKSVGRQNQLKAENGLRLVEGYLGKVKESASYIRKNRLVKDQGNGRVQSKTYMDLTTDKVEVEQNSADDTSDFYIIGALASLNIAVFLFEIATPIKNSNFELFTLPLIYGAKINNLILMGEWWRLVTPMFLHSGIFHIALGIWILYSFGIKVSQEYGSFTFLFIYILGGVSGNLISFLHTPEPTVGGTGPAFAVIGAWLINQLQNKDVIARDASETMYQKAVIAAALICVLSNFGPIDDWSHFAATFTGVAYGFVTCPTLQVKDISPEVAQPQRFTLVRRYADPCRSIFYFSVFVLLLSSLLFVIEPPLDLME